MPLAVSGKPSMPEPQFQESLLASCARVVRHVGLVAEFGAEVIVEDGRERRMRGGFGGIVELRIQQALRVGAGEAAVEAAHSQFLI